MKKEWMLVLIVSIVTALSAIVCIKLFLPDLLHQKKSPDLQLVQLEKKLPSFYENIFRKDDYNQQNRFLINDPAVILRNNPLYPDLYNLGSHDILGFRNRSVPFTTSIVTLGDSQTYGNNVLLEDNWPSRLKVYISDKGVDVYNMSCGGWNAPQYLEMFPKALFFKPQVVIIAFYSGNDPLSSIIHVYGSDRWKSLQLNSDFEKSSINKFKEKIYRNRQDWRVEFNDGSMVVFTPSDRLITNLKDNSIVTLGYDILCEVAKRISHLARKAEIPVIFTIIPTKELVYSDRVKKESIQAPEEYKELVKGEMYHIDNLAKQIKGMPGVIYVDVLEPLKMAADNSLLYRSSGKAERDKDGHPTEKGYDIIAKTIAPYASKYIPIISEGIFIYHRDDGKKLPYFFKKGRIVELTKNQVSILKNRMSESQIKKLPVLERNEFVRYFRTNAVSDQQIIEQVKKIIEH